MTVRYIQVNPVVNLFAPALRAFGNIAIVGKVGVAGEPSPTNPPLHTPVVFTDPASARDQVPGELGEAIALAFAQSPGPVLIHGVRVDSTAPDWAAGLNAVSTLDVQLVALANTPLNAGNAGPTAAIGRLLDHVTSVSNTGGDGKERMGVVMLEKGATAVDTLVTGALANDRMVYIAHKSTQDAAAAVTGAIAGQQPHISLLLKQVNITSPSFTPAEIEAINGTETDTSGPRGKGVNWLTSPSLIPGQAVYLGEGYTGNPGGKKFIDVVRTVDDVTFRLKARLIKTIGNVRISRSGLRALIAQMEAVLEPLVRNEVIEGFEIIVPVLTLLDRDPATLTPGELQQIRDAQDQRVVEVMTAVDYAGAIHRLAITLKFE